MTTSAEPRYDDLSALFFNCTLKPSPQLSHTQGLMDLSASIMADADREVAQPADLDFTHAEAESVLQAVAGHPAR